MAEARGTLKTDDPNDRGWYLLALRRAEALDTAIKDRRQIVLKLLEDAEVAFRSRAAQRGDHDQK